MRVLLFLFFITTLYADLLMMIEFNTNGTIKSNPFNFSLHTVELNVTVIGCDTGYYDVNPPGMPFVCLECQCTQFDGGRVERFVESNV